MSRRHVRLGLIVVTMGVVAAAACTAFDDVPGPSAAVGDDASTDGSTAPPDADARTGILSLPEAAKVCSLVARCYGLGASIAATLRFPLAEPGYSLCLSELTTTLEPQRLGVSLTRSVLLDIAATDTCAAAGALLSIELTPPGDPRCIYDAGGVFTTCLDDVTALGCNGSGQLGLLRHCGKPNRSGTEHCFAYDGGSECAAEEGCAGATCLGSVLDVCRPRTTLPLYHARTDCALLGMQCAVTKTGSIGCSTDSTQILERADGIFGGGCDGNMRYSKSEIYFSQVDCAALGGRCVASGRTGICTFPSDECSPIVTPDECTGTTFHGCVGGKKTAFDCANIGKACSQVGAVRAACQ